MQRVRHGHAGTFLTARPLQSADAAALDAADSLAAFAQQFHHPRDSSGRKLLYFGGHSLGLQPISAAGMIEQELDDWRRLGVLGHHDATRPWIPYHERAAPALAALTGAMESEVVAMNSLTVNLHLMMVSFFRPRGARTKVLIERSAFPSDRYAVVSQLEFHGLNAAEHLIEVEPRAGERNLRTEDLLQLIEREGPRLALVLLPGVQYLTGQLLDMETLIAAARRAGAAAGIDLAHAIGNTPLRLHDWNCDFAVWCSYKYLNAGPGAVGGCFVHERHGRDFKLPRFAGWWGHNKAERFLYDPRFDPIEGAQGWQISNPPILSTAPLLASLEIFQRAGIAALRRKSIALSGFMQRLIEERLPGAVEIITPGAPEQRGCQLSLRIAQPAAQAKQCLQRLSSAGVIGDWREPDVLRLAPIPLYNSFADVFGAVEILAQAVRA
ncbi:MAG TPA: kynureninase [Steroidobacteraceae bacterium]|nr:kynureninase [Steroidobacteraceae bacterium]